MSSSEHYLLHLSRQNYSVIARRMLDDDAQGGTSFPDVMSTLRGTSPPDVYALTAYSALPIADAVRGYHEQLSLPEPTFTSIRADRKTSRATREIKDAHVFFEATRIKPVVDKKNVILIDQFVALGATINLGRVMLRSAGARAIRSDQSVRWYDQASANEVDETTMTSDHATFMREIGARAAIISSNK